MMRCTPTGLLASVLLFALLFTVACQQTDTSVPETLACDNLSFAVTTAQPLDSVAVTGVPDELRGVVGAEARVPGDTSVAYSWLTQDSTSGAWSLIVPLYPGGRLEGGLVEVRMGNTQGMCPAQSFTIAALPEAPGTVAAVADALERTVAARAAQFGATPADLRQVDFTRTFPPLQAVAMAQAALDHPGNPNSLRQILAGESPRYNRQKPDLRVLDALWAKMGLVDRMNALTQRIETAPRFPTDLLETYRQKATSSAMLDEPSAQAWTPRPASSPTPFRTASLTSSLPAPASPRTMEVCPGPESFYKPDAETLSRFMKNSLAGEVASTGEARKIFGVLQLTLATGAALPIPVYRDVMGTAGALSVGYMFNMEAAAGILPRTFTSMDVTLSKPHFLEDENSQGQWSNLTVTATSEGWEGPKKVLEEAINYGTGKAAGITSAGVSKVDYQDLYATAMSQTANDAKMASGLADAALGDKQIKWGPCEFGPTDVSDEQWSRVRLTGEPAIALLSDGKTYVPQQAGTATLIFSTKPGMYGDGQLGNFGLEMVQLSKTVQVKAIEVKVLPPRVRVKPGESVTFRAEVTNALDPNLEWSITPAKHTVITAGPHKHLVDVTTSKDPDDFAATLKAVSTADRSHLKVAPERSGAAIIQGSELILVPASACVRPSDTQLFEVQTPDVEAGEIVLSGGADASGGTDFNWTASTGSVSNRGVFTPPSGDGKATITARSKEDPTIMGRATVRYGEQCLSQYSFTATGTPSIQQSGTIQLFRGDERPEGCFVQIMMAPPRDINNPNTPPSLSLKTMLPQGLRSGTYEVGPNYPPPAEPWHKFGTPSDIMEIPAASPSFFFGSLYIGEQNDLDGWGDSFRSHSGVVTVERDDENVSMEFTIDLLEDDTEGLNCDPAGIPYGVPCTIPPRRKASVQGQLTHVLRTDFEYFGSRNYFGCKPPAQ